MEQLLPKWIMKRYLVLIHKSRQEHKKEFGFQFAEDALHDALGDNKRVVGLFLSELSKAGWLRADFDPKDRRMRIYQLKEYKDVFEDYTQAILKNKNK